MRSNAANVLAEELYHLVDINMFTKDHNDRLTQLIGEVGRMQEVLRSQELNLQTLSKEKEEIALANTLKMDGNITAECNNSLIDKDNELISVQNQYLELEREYSKLKTLFSNMISIEEGISKFFNSVNNRASNLLEGDASDREAALSLMVQRAIISLPKDGVISISLEQNKVVIRRDA